MGKEKLFIPKSIKVGYNYREETYSKKLAYVIYYDAKGKLRKEGSWTNWIQTPEKVRNNNRYEGLTDELINSFEPSDMDNSPLEGFVLNRGVGGQRHSYGWNARNEYIRVWDPRGFEIEISVSNLLFILQETTSTKGKGLEGEFVYAWDGKDLVLLPVDTEDYRTSSDFTNLQGKKVTKKDMMVGSAYTDKNANRLIYVGRYDWREYLWSNDWGVSKKHVFYNIDTNLYSPYNGFTKLATRDTETCVDYYAELLDEFLKSKNHSTPVDLIMHRAILNPGTENGVDYPHSVDYNNDKHELYQIIGGKFYRVEIEDESEWDEGTRNSITKGFYIKKCHYVELDKNKSLTERGGDRYSWRYDMSIHGELLTKEEVEKLDFYNLFVILDGGTETIIGDYNNRN